MSAIEAELLRLVSELGPEVVEGLISMVKSAIAGNLSEAKTKSIHVATLAAYKASYRNVNE